MVQAYMATVNRYISPFNTVPRLIMSTMVFTMKHSNTGNRSTIFEIVGTWPGLDTYARTSTLWQRHNVGAAYDKANTISELPVTVWPLAGVRL